jgi:hypothetical protein
MQLRLTRARGVAAAAVLAAAAAAAVAAPAPAHAWPGDHNVTVTGKITRCSSPGGIQSMSVRGNLNNQIATWSTQSTSANPTYSLRWTNVPNGSGGNAFYVVHCGVTPDYSGWIHVYQPLVGETLGGINI